MDTLEEWARTEEKEAILLAQIETFLESQRTIVTQIVS